MLHHPSRMASSAGVFWGAAGPLQVRSRYSTGRTALTNTTETAQELQNAAHTVETTLCPIPPSHGHPNRPSWPTSRPHSPNLPHDSQRASPPSPEAFRAASYALLCSKLAFGVLANQHTSIRSAFLPCGHSSMPEQWLARPEREGSAWRNVAQAVL